MRYILSIILLLAPGLVHAQVWFVDKDNTSGVENGTSWTTAFTTIQPAIHASFGAGGGDVWIAEGVYDEQRSSLLHDPPTETGSLVLKANVRLVGGFSGVEKSFEQRDVALFSTVIDGSTSRGGDPAFHVIFAEGTALLDGLTIQGGRSSRSSQPPGADRGSNLLAIEGSGHVIRNCTFAHAEFSRGEAILIRGEAFIDSCVFRDATGDSRVLSVSGDGSVVSNCLFVGNSGSGVFAGGLGFVIRNCEFRSNSGDRSPALWGNRSLLVLNCLFIDNENTELSGVVAGQGGTYRNCVFMNNRAAGDGGAVEVAGRPGRHATAVFENCLFVGNHAEGFGGALALKGATVIFEDEPNSRTSIANCTFVNNTAGMEGGAIHSGIAKILMLNSILWNNSKPGIANELELTNQVVGISDTIIEGGIGVEGPRLHVLDFDPLFVDPAGNDFRLRADSPAIDIGMPSFAIPFFLETLFAPSDDLVGHARPLGGGWDLGAYEFAGSAEVCSLVDTIRSEFDAFLVDRKLDGLDPGDGLPADAALALMNVVACELTGLMPQVTNEAYAINQQVFGVEPQASGLTAYATLIPALMLLSTEMQQALRDELQGTGIALVGNYVTVQCNRAALCRIGLPFASLRAAEDGWTEIYSGIGDPDSDGLSNAAEFFDLVTTGGLTIDDFARAALGLRSNLGGNGGGSCLIATAAYGTPLEHDIDILRAFRDDALLTNPLGAAFVDTYYRLSPPFAKRLAKSERLRGAVRTVLHPVIRVLDQSSP